MAGTFRMRKFHQLCMRQCFLFRGKATDTSFVPSKTNSQQLFSNDLWQSPVVQKYLDAYEDIVGLTEVKNAQDKVLQAEQKFLDMQVIRRQKQLDLIAVQAKLREIATELEKLQRGDDRYLALLTQEHSVIGDETKILREINEIEESEKTYFASLSSAVRESHEKERSRAERTKYWSVTASVIGAVLGIFGTSINNYLRMRELKTMVREQAAEGQSTKELIQNLSNSLLTQQQLVASFVDDVKNTVGDVGGTSTSAAVLTGTEKKLDALIDTNSSLQRDLLDIKQAISKNIVSTGHVNATVSEHDLTTSFRSVEQKLDSRLKSNAVYTASLVYGGFAISVAVLYAILKGT